MNRKRFKKAYEKGFNTDFKGKIIIVGAGIAGITAAHFLHKSNIDFEILEASNVYGGRIRPHHEFSDFPIELGAEEIHGKKSVWFDLIHDYTKADFFDASNEQEDYTFLDEKLWSERQVERMPDFRKVMAFINEMEEYDEEDKSTLELLKTSDIPKKFYALINAWTANEYGASLAKIGAKSRADLFQNWSSGEQNYVLENTSYLTLIEQLFPEVLSKIQLNTIVKKIDYSAEKVVLTDQNERTYTAEHILLTVPLSILKSNDIAFNPELPAVKKEAIETVGMGAGMKILLKFKAHFWKEDTGSLYGQGFIPEFYTTGYGKSNEAILTAFVMGENAEHLSSLGEQAIGIALEELDQMFGNRLASENFERGFVMDWYKEPFIKGAYSYPSPESEEARYDLRDNIAQKIFFAGEAYNVRGHSGTVHGAIETAYTSLEAILKN